MAICSGDCQDQGCKMIAECERVYKASSPPCAELVDEKFTSTNTRMAKCLELVEDIADSGPVTGEDAREWALRARQALRHTITLFETTVSFLYMEARHGW